MLTIERIQLALKDDTDKILNHPFIKNLTKGVYSIGHVRIFAEQYYLLSVAFTRFLILASSSISNEKYRVPIIDNIYDEHGRGNYLHSHRVLLVNFMKSIGTKDVSKIKALPSTSANIYGMLKLCESGSLHEIIGAIGPGCEYFTDEQYSKIVKPLSEKYNVPKDDLFFFYEHIDHDPRHTSDIDNIIIEITKNDAHVDEVIFGAKQAIIFETIFWDGIYNACKL